MNHQPQRPPGTLSLAEAMRRLGLRHSNDLHRLRDRGDIQVYRIGATWCVVERSVESYKQQQEQVQGSEARS